MIIKRTNINISSTRFNKYKDNYRYNSNKNKTKINMQNNYKNKLYMYITDIYITDI